MNTQLAIDEDKETAHLNALADECVADFQPFEDAFRKFMDKWNNFLSADDGHYPASIEDKLRELGSRLSSMIDEYDNM